MSVDIHSPFPEARLTVKGKTYVEAVGRGTGQEKGVSHLYLETELPDPDDARFTIEDYAPMCAKGWNRDGGESFSIFRGWRGKRGLCKTCLKRAKAGLDGVESLS